MTLQQIVEALAKGPDPENHCQLCGVPCYIPEGMAPTALCMSCAQDAAGMLPSLVPPPGTSRVPTVLLSRLMLTLMGVCLAAKGETDSGKVVADAANILDIWEEAARRGESPTFEELKAALDQALDAAKKVASAAGAVELRAPRVWKPGDE